MKTKILIVANISVLAFVLTGCPSKSIQEKSAKEHTKQEMLKRSDQQFKDMEKQMDK